MKFLIGLTTGLILAWGTPKALARMMVAIPPGDPVGWAPRHRIWKNGVEQ